MATVSSVKVSARETWANEGKIAARTAASASGSHLPLQHKTMSGVMTTSSAVRNPVLLTVAVSGPLLQPAGVQDGGAQLKLRSGRRRSMPSLAQHQRRQHKRGNQAAPGKEG